MSIVRTLDFQLRPQFGSKVQGSVRVEAIESGHVIKVTLRDLVADATYLVNFHAGSCASEDTSVIIDGPRFRSDAAGTSTVNITRGTAYTVPAAGRILTLHGPLDTPEAFTHIACADLTN